MKKLNEVKLTAKERQILKELVRKGKEKARKLTRCRILLLSDTGKSDSEIINVLEISRNTIRQVRKRYNLSGVEAAINEKERPGAPKKFTGKQKAKITALACSNPPEGRSRWTLRLLADKVVELDIVGSICPETVNSILKKTNLSHTSRNNGA